MHGKPRTLLCLAISIVTLVGAAVSLRAQDVPSRRGPFIGFGFGYGSAKLSCNLCQESIECDISGFAKMGFALTDQCLVRQAGRQQAARLVRPFVLDVPQPEQWFLRQGRWRAFEVLRLEG